MTDGQP